MYMFIFMYVCACMDTFKTGAYTHTHTHIHTPHTHQPPPHSFPARGGGTVEIDARPSALRRALGPQLLAAVEGEGEGPVGVGMKASTPYGEGRVVGVARGDVW